MKTIRHITILLLSSSLLWACQEKPVSAPEKVKEPLIEKNKSMARKEDDRINAFIERRKWTMEKTGTGLRYMVYEKGNGPKAETGQTALVNYTISLLNGKVCYATGEGPPKAFLIGQDHVESGIHEGILFLNVGDKARMILPPHLAFGLTGDRENIPPYSTVIYDLELLALK